MNTTWHVSKNGNDYSLGTEENPFLTIGKAAVTASYGDRIVVHEGIYREWVQPQHSGKHPLAPIIYEAAPNEKVIIKGSEIITNWTHVHDTIWMKKLPNSFFGTFNPYEKKIIGDWFLYPTNWNVHAGNVYINNKAMYEASSLDTLETASKRYEGFTPGANDKKPSLLFPEETIYQWYSSVTDEETIIYCNFQDINPNNECIEINVRQACFYPLKTNINYITLQGFEFAHAATLWTPPTGNQIGMIGPNWSKGWIIENNILHDSKCSGISLGKNDTTGDNDATLYKQKSAYQYQLESVFKAEQLGWSKDLIGSHTIRNNIIYDCGQNGIVGHMGCIYSTIEHNHIYNIGIKHEYFGWEIAGIKLHAPIDVVIHDNCIHHCTLGLWLDWQAQGSDVSNNILYKNGSDCTIEVTHGPLIIHNNIFASPIFCANHAQGTAFLHNLITGGIRRLKILDRATPYHVPHSTQVAGYAFTYTSDDRIYNNIFVGHTEKENSNFAFGTQMYDECPPSYEIFNERLNSNKRYDQEKYADVEQPVFIDANSYLNRAKPYVFEKNKHIDIDFNPKIEISELDNCLYLDISIPEELTYLSTQLQSTESLGHLRITDAIYDNKDGILRHFDRDLFDNKRSKKPMPGPIEKLKVGTNRIKIWEKPLI